MDAGNNYCLSWILDIIIVFDVLAIVYNGSRHKSRASRTSDTNRRYRVYIGHKTYLIIIIKTSSTCSSMVNKIVYKFLSQPIIKYPCP